MFGVSYGSFDFYNQPKIGLICLYSLKNPSFPEYICRAPCGVLCLDISTHYPNLIVAGLYDGNVAVYNLCSGSGAPSHISCAGSGKHKDPVWQVEDNLPACLSSTSRYIGPRTTWKVTRTSTAAPATAG